MLYCAVIKQHRDTRYKAAIVDEISRFLHAAVTFRDI